MTYNALSHFRIYYHFSNETRRSWLLSSKTLKYLNPKKLNCNITIAAKDIKNFLSSFKISKSLLFSYFQTIIDY